jgi:hypothetical protein
MGSDIDILDELREEREAWRADHDDAMACYDVEDMILRGVALFFGIRRADESWTKKVQAGTVKFDPQRATAIHRQYEWWLAPCDDVLVALEKAERSFREVSNAEVFRQCVNLARRLVLIDVNGLIESAEQVARGEVEPITEADLGGDKAQLVA